MATALVWAHDSRADPSLGSLRSALAGQRARERSLSASISRLDGAIASLDGQISLVRRRAAAVASQLAADRGALARVSVALARERALRARLELRLARARAILASQLVSGYESARPDLMSVVLQANGFSQLLDELVYLGAAENRQQSIILITRAARAQADAATRALAALDRSDRLLAAETELHARALAGMDALLTSREAAITRARDAQQAALGAVAARGRRLQGEIAHVQAQLAAAAAAAQRAAQASPSYGPAGAPGGWAIPYPIVLCESGGQNLPPNSAGASGYYQIIPSTWKLFGGSGPAAYLAPKSEQDTVAARIWRGGAGASNWVCAGIVGYR
ncbi:MAG TPA: transglycosylase family protein [Solirubrobacteraceae bacterium]|nr:transglycosylase family protein [Solirubrobacteraceae bacterium]